MVNAIYNIPDTWEWVYLDDVSEKITDGSHNPPKARDSGIPMLSARNIHNNEVNFSDVRYLSDEDFESENQRTNLKASDVLLTTVGTIGRSALVPHNIKFALQRSVTVVKPLINPKYLSYYFQSSDFQKELKENSSGTAQKGIYLNVLKKLSVPIATIEEQLRIVEKIEELFSKLDKNLEQFKRSLQDVDNLWIVSINKSIGFENGFTYLGELAKIRGGKRLPKNFSYSESETKYPYIRVSDFSNYGIDDRNLKYISEELYNKLINYSISNDDVYISIAGTIGLVGSVSNKLSNAILTENAAKIIFNDKELLKDYLIYVLDSPVVKEQIKRSVKATSQPKLALYKILEFKVPKHDIKEQKLIVEKLDEIRMYCENLKDSINENYSLTIDLKNKVLHEAFRGKLTDQRTTDTSLDITLKLIKSYKEQYLHDQFSNVRRTKIKKMEKEKLSLLQVLEKCEKPISAKQLWQDSMFNENIEKFYLELKKIQERIVEEKTEKGSIISLK